MEPNICITVCQIRGEPIKRDTDITRGHVDGEALWEPIGEDVCARGCGDSIKNGEQRQRIEKLPGKVCQSFHAETRQELIWFYIQRIMSSL